MNIQEAKTEICNTLRAYLAKDENGYYTYPLIRQRPLLLIGPPGIGKTAIMEQAAAECGVGLVAYTITHHTRQSAIGLPEIVKRNYGGKGMMVTDYTMSEIVASVYDCMENTGRKEGILFIDEINCVSETLAPAMLALLQNKTFGSHKIPEGWILVAAGNPPEYNKSVREFDIVTLDRVRKLTIEPDCDIWLKYAGQQKVHQAIISYLSVKKNNFYAVENTVDGKFFVTARGWEDLSRLLQSYEKLGIGISEELMEEFLQKEETARDFAGFYQLYTKYGEDYEIPSILSGNLSRENLALKEKMAADGAFEERFAVVNLILGALREKAEEYGQADHQLEVLYEMLLHLRTQVRKNAEEEKLGIGISEELVEEFLQKEETARDFAGFYQLYTKYGEDYEIPSILSGNMSPENLALKEKMAADGAFEERFAVVNLILGALREKAEEYGHADHQLEILHEMLLHLRTQVRKNAEEEKLGISLLEEFVQEQENSLQIKVKMELISVREQKYQETAIRRLREYILTAKKEHVRSAENGFKRISKCFEKEAVCREDMIQKLQGELQNAFSFIKESFGENQEMLLFVTGITADKSMTSFIAGNGCPAYFEHSEMLLYNKEENELRKACLEAVHERLQEESRDRV